MMKGRLLLLVSLGSLELFAQESPLDSTRSDWSYSAWAEVFFLPDEHDFFNPTFYARKKNLHLEGRYNYEDLNTASVWVGRRFLFGKTAKFVLVPMGAIVFGNTNGMAPGLELEVVYKSFDFYSESEFVFDFSTSDNNFFYVYSELAWRPIQPLRTGLTIQRTKLVESEFEMQRGILVEYYFKRFRVGAFYFNPFTSDHFLIASLSVDF